MRIRGPFLRKMMRPAIALGLGGLVALGAAEVASRVLDRPASRGPNPDLYRPSADPELLYSIRPNFRGLAHGAWVEINGLGFRGPEISSVRKPGGIRVALVGDSIAFGFGLEEAETLSVQIERQLAPLLRPGLDIEVLNFGVCGYNLRQELEVLRTRVLPLSPDVVVSVLMSNDADRMSPIAARPPAWKRIGRSYSRLYGLYESARWAARVPDPAKHSPIGHPLLRPLAQELEVRQGGAWDDFMGTLEAFGDELGRARCPWIVAYWGGPGAFAAALDRALERRKLHFVPMAMAYDGRLEDPSFTLGWDAHPNSRAARAMAMTLAAGIALKMPWALKPEVGTIEKLRECLAAQRRSWSRESRISEARRAQAIRALPAELTFDRAGRAVPFGVLQGIEADGAMNRDITARLAISGEGQMLEIAGSAEEGATLRVDTPGGDGWIDHRIASPEFSIKVDRAGPSSAGYRSIALRNTGAIKLKSIRWARRDDATSRQGGADLPDGREMPAAVFESIGSRVSISVGDIYPSRGGYGPTWPHNKGSGDPWIG